MVLRPEWHCRVAGCRVGSRALSVCLVVWAAQCVVFALECRSTEAVNATGPRWDNLTSQGGGGAEASIAWSGTPLREALSRFGRAQGITVLVDRRVDPGQRLVLSVDSMPARQVLEQIAASRGLGVSHLGPVTYLGPTIATARLRTLAALRAADVARLPAAVQYRFTQLQAWRWDDLEVPRQLLQDLGRQTGVGIRGLELVPHDLWPAVELPPLPLVDRLTLVANQFDLTFVVAPSGGSVRLVPIAAPVHIERRYRHARLSRRLMRDLADEMPAATWRFEAGGLVLRGRVEDHERLVASLTPRASPSQSTARTRNRVAAEAEKRYTLTVKDQPVGPLVRQLASKLDLDLEIDSAAIRKAGRSLDKRVSFQVRNATIGQLFRAALRPAGLDFARQGRQLHVGPGDR
jgi:hypothetical protein